MLFQSTSAAEFFTKMRNGFHCMYSLDANCRTMVGKAWLFYFGYCFGNLFQFLLIQYAEGAVFAVIVQAMVAPTCTIFWTFFNYNEVTDVFKWSPIFNTTTGFTLAGLCMIVPGVILYNYFSRQEATEVSRAADGIVNVRSRQIPGKRPLPDVFWEKRTLHYGNAIDRNCVYRFFFVNSIFITH